MRRGDASQDCPGIEQTAINRLLDPTPNRLLHRHQNGQFRRQGFARLGQRLGPRDSKLLSERPTKHFGRPVGFFLGNAVTLHQFRRKIAREICLPEERRVEHLLDEVR